MSLKYGLRENALNTKTKNFIASPQSDGTKTLEDIITLMIGKGSTVTRAEAYSVIEEFNWAIEQILQNGDSIVTPMFNIAPSITGTFETEDERFDKSKHQVNININAGVRLSKIADIIPIERIETSQRLPLPKTFVDVIGETENTNLTPGGIGHIKGSSLKVDTTDAQQGVFFIAKDSTETRVAKIARNKPGELIFMIPNTLKKGAYRIEVRTIFHNSKNLRTGVLPVPLTVK